MTVLRLAASLNGQFEMFMRLVFPEVEKDSVQWVCLRDSYFAGVKAAKRLSDAGVSFEAELEAFGRELDGGGVRVRRGMSRREYDSHLLLHMLGRSRRELLADERGVEVGLVYPGVGLRRVPVSCDAIRVGRRDRAESRFELAAA